MELEWILQKQTLLWCVTTKKERSPMQTIEKLEGGMHHHLVEGPTIVRTFLSQPVFSCQGQLT